MKISKETEVNICLKLYNNDNCLEIKDGQIVRIVTDETEFEEEIIGTIDIVDNEILWIDGIKIPINYIKEIYVL